MVLVPFLRDVVVANKLPTVFSDVIEITRVSRIGISMTCSNDTPSSELLSFFIREIVRVSLDVRTSMAYGRKNIDAPDREHRRQRCYLNRRRRGLLLTFDHPSRRKTMLDPSCPIRKSSFPTLKLPVIVSFQLNSPYSVPFPCTGTQYWIGSCLPPRPRFSPCFGAHAVDTACPNTSP